VKRRLPFAYEETLVDSTLTLGLEVAAHCLGGFAFVEKLRGRTYLVEEQGLSKIHEGR
jgi:hypothetical protein